MTELSTTYLGLRLRSPLIASASPATSTVDGLRRLEDAGVGAVVLPSLFEEQLEHEEHAVGRFLDLGQGHPEAAGYFPDLEDHATGPDRHLALVEEARAAVEVPVVASLNGVTSAGLARHALERLLGGVEIARIVVDENREHGTRARPWSRAARLPRADRAPLPSAAPSPPP